MSLSKNISNWLKDYLMNNKLSCFVVGISGGIDSAVTSTLCANTGIKTIVVSLPINQNKDQLLRANNHIKWLKKNYSNVFSYEIDLTKIFIEFNSIFDFNSNLASANSRSRLRMVSLYHIATNYNGLVVGTGNKVEDFGVGFFTKYGDGGVDISPIADLTKTEVRILSKDLGIIDEIIIAKPTDGLWEDDRSDEDQIGATYEELEYIMDLIEKDGSIDLLSSRQKVVYEIYQNLNTKNKHKMIPIPTYKK